jgi:hypothetical protein
LKNDEYVTKALNNLVVNKIFETPNKELTRNYRNEFFNLDNKQIDELIDIVIKNHKFKNFPPVATFHEARKEVVGIKTGMQIENTFDPKKYFVSEEDKPNIEFFESEHWKKTIAPLKIARDAKICAVDDAITRILSDEVYCVKKACWVHRTEVIEDYFVDPIQKINIFALKTDQLRRLEHVIDITKELKRRNLKVTNILRRKS